MKFDRNTLGRQAKELGFVRDTFEKVTRLADVLKYFESDRLISETLALKGGTAINLTIFDLPRLSVDIDLDFAQNISRDEMLEKREIITDRMKKYMSANGYILSGKSKNYHALDSFVYEYINAGGMKDNLKIEINYMLRCHIFPVTKRKVNLSWLDEELSVLSVAPMEIFASKIVALLNRTAARDLYDIHNMLKFGLFDETEQELLKCGVIYYSCIGSDEVRKEFTYDSIRKMPQNKIKTELLPVLRYGAYFDLNPAQENVIKYLEDLLAMSDKDIAFIETFEKGEYMPDILFEKSIADNLLKHPMAIWKCSNNLR